MPRRAVRAALPLPDLVVLVLQGGGALGAFQAGVYEALIELGIELALQRGRADIASDLIVFSRTAGFVAAEIPGTDREQADLPLLPVPHQRDLDAMSSSWTIS